MKLPFILLLFWMPWAGWAADLPADVDLEIPYQKEALTNSLRCLETIRGDDYRTALNRTWVAENLASLGQDAATMEILRSSAPHYVIPYGCVESALALLGQGRNQAVRQLVDLAILRISMTDDRGRDEALLQTLILATVVENSEAVSRAWESHPAARKKLGPAYEAFMQDWRPNLWNQWLDWLRPARQWQELKRGATRDEQAAWIRERMVDGFTARVFLKEAAARVRRGEGYPSHWVFFARAGVQAPSPNTRPIAIQAELASLAELEGRDQEAIQLAQSAANMMQAWAPHMTGMYPVLRDLVALRCVANAGKELHASFLARAENLSKALVQALDSYEKMLQLPLLAETFYALGAKGEAEDAWKTATELCAQNQNPESQSIGLTRIWMSFARANTWPDKETEALLLKTEKQLPEAYSKVNF